MDSDIEAAVALDAEIAEIDRAISAQLDRILHHPDFQRLEAAWIGVRLLVETAPAPPSRLEMPDDGPESSGVMVSVLNLSVPELREDLRYVKLRDFRKSEVFDLVYNRAYNTFGGVPFSLLVVDHEFDDKPADVSLLSALAILGQASFTGVAAGVRPELFNVDRFGQLYFVADATPGAHRQAMALLFSSRSSPSKIEWNELRGREEARFLALTLPRILMRRPYDYRRGLGLRASARARGLARARGDDDSLHRCAYRERVSPDGSENLWGNAAFALAAVAIDCHKRTGWLADIHGLSADGVGGGIVPTGFQESDEFETDSSGVVTKPLTDVLINDLLEKELAEHGLMVLTHRPREDYAAFCSTPSLHKPGDASDADQRMGAMFHYTLCVSRFAHAIKKLGHRRAGELTSSREVEGMLRDLLIGYVLNSDDASPAQTAERPLRSCDVTVEGIPGRPGEYHCRIGLQPHHEMDAARVELVTEMVGAR